MCALWQVHTASMLLVPTGQETILLIECIITYWKHIVDNHIILYDVNCYKLRSRNANTNQIKKKSILAGNIGIVIFDYKFSMSSSSSQRWWYPSRYRRQKENSCNTCNRYCLFFCTCISCVCIVCLSSCFVYMTACTYPIKAHTCWCLGWDSL